MRDEQCRRHRHFLNTFTTYIDSGFGLIKGEVGYLSSTLIVIDITSQACSGLGADEDILQRLVKKTLYIGFFAFIITNFNNPPPSSSTASPASA